MTVAKRFRRLSRISLHKYRIRMRQAHHKEVDFAFYATNHTQRLAKIYLRVARTM
jgi:hypothetical protein